MNAQNTENGGLKLSNQGSTIMPKPEREKGVLAPLDEIGEPLPPKLVYRILRVRGATFGRRSVMRYCSELAERGQLVRIDPDGMDEGELRVADDPGKRAYYMITDAGRARVDE